MLKNEELEGGVSDVIWERRRIKINLILSIFDEKYHF
jgi:hypothetical protein